MAKRRMPPRHKSGPKKGRFMTKAERASRSRSRPKRNPGRSVAKRRAAPKRAAAPRRAAAKRRPARRNPVRRRPVNIVRSLTEGSIEAVQILIGKAAARSLPDLIGAPKEGNIGLAVQAATALVAGYVSGMFLSPNASRAILAGGLTAPIETLVVAYQVPWLSAALSPVTTAASLNAYATPRAALSGYVKRRPAPLVLERGMAGYVSSSERGMGYGYDD